MEKLRIGERMSPAKTAAERASDGALTVMVINKTTSAMATVMALNR